MMLRRRPDISVIIPTCRPAKLIYCLEQLNRQVVPVDLVVETIVVTEMSLSDIPLPRSCEVLIKDLGGNCGASARDLGIAISRGRYLSFWDDDNIYMPHALLTQYMAAYGNDVGVVQIDHWDGLQYHRLPLRLPNNLVLGDVDTMCLCVRREVAVKEKWDDHKGIGTDYYWLEKILKRGASLNFVPVAIGEHL